MPVGMDHTSVLRIYCLARQAERSIDFALHSQEQWELFRQYYDEARLRRLYDLVRELETSTPNGSASISSDQIPGITPSWVLSYPLRWLVNRIRITWMFSATEIRYISHVLRTFIEVTGSVVRPGLKDLVQLRMDLYVAELVIEKKLTGLSSLEKARDIEHFCQNDYRVYFSLEEVLQGSGSFGPSAERILR
jgi:hypothetical protein